MIYGHINGTHFPDHPSTTYLALAITAIGATVCATLIPRDWNAPKYRVPDDDEEEEEEESDETSVVDDDDEHALDEPFLQVRKEIREKGEADPLPVMTTLRRGASLFPAV